jgi:hypothetical protein
MFSLSKAKICFWKSFANWVGPTFLRWATGNTFAAPPARPNPSTTFAQRTPRERNPDLLRCLRLGFRRWRTAATRAAAPPSAGLSPRPPPPPTESGSGPPPPRPPPSRTRSAPPSASSARYLPLTSPGVSSLEVGTLSLLFVQPHGAV